MASARDVRAAVRAARMQRGGMAGQVLPHDARSIRRVGRAAAAHGDDGSERKVGRGMRDRPWTAGEHGLSAYNRRLLSSKFGITENGLDVMSEWANNDRVHDTDPRHGGATFNERTLQELAPYTTELTIQRQFFRGDQEFKFNVTPFDNPIDSGEYMGAPIYADDMSTEDRYNFFRDTWEERWAAKFAGIIQYIILMIRGPRVGSSDLPASKQLRISVYDCNGTVILSRVGSGADIASWSRSSKYWRELIMKGVRDLMNSHDKSHRWWDSDERVYKYGDEFTGEEFVRNGYLREWGEGNVQNFAPCRVEATLMNAPDSGGGKPRERVRFNRDLFTDFPQKFLKSVIDCGTTPGTFDCAIRALCYAYLVKNDAYIHAPNEKLEFKDSEATAAAKAKTNSRRKYRNTIGDVMNSHLYKDLTAMKAALHRHDPRPEMINQPIEPETLIAFCVQGCLGFNARIKVFVPANDGVTLRHQTDDRRPLAIDNPLVSAIPETDEERKQRLELEPEGPWLLQVPGVPPETQPTAWYYLLLHNDHYYHVEKPGIICNNSKYCDTCDVAYQHDRAHACKDKCQRCYSRECPRGLWQNVDITCADCFRQFHSQKCYENHKKKDRRGGGPQWRGRSVCDNFWMCTDPRCSNMIYNAYRCARSLHVHGNTHWCAACQAYVKQTEHQCYILKKDFRWQPKKFDLWFFDLETTTDRVSGNHVCNHAQVMNSDGSVHHVFNDLEGLCNFMFADLGKEMGPGDLHKRFISHNGGRFDMHLVTHYMHVSGRKFAVENISKGNTLMLLHFAVKVDVDEPEPAPHEYVGSKRNRKVDKSKKKNGIDTSHSIANNLMTISFTDSMNFIKGSLRSFTKTFGIKETKKGDFPHYFNDGSDYSLNYSGTIPAIEEFGVESFSKDRLEEFLPWYHDKIYETYEDSEEAELEWVSIMDKYGSGLELKMNSEDVIMYKGPWIFEKEMREYCFSDVELLRKGCMSFREQLMTVYTPISPRSGMVDGVYYKKGDIMPAVDPFSALTMASFCYDMYLRYFYEHKLLGHFDRETERWIRRGFSGGRTEAFTLFYRAKPTDWSMPIDNQEQILSVDFCSEYPFVNHEGMYTGGWPVTISTIDDWRREVTNSAEYPTVTNMEEAIKQWAFHTEKGPEGQDVDKIGNPFFVNGLIMAELTYKGPIFKKIPVLGGKRIVAGSKYNKFVFDLEEHKELVVNGLELWEALQDGYDIYDVKRIMWWPKHLCRRGIFAQYVDTFLTAKIEAGGWPKECVGDTDEHKHKQKEWIDYIEHNNPGVKLNVGNISDRKNHGKYAVAKICLNSVWGKANQRSNLQNKKYFNPTQYTDYYHIMTDPTLTCSWKEVVNGKIGEVTYKSTEDSYEMTKNTCITVGVWTTAQGRLMLYRHMKKLHESQVLYVDTDSIKYIWDPNNRNHVKLETKENVLGSLSNEFKKYQEDGYVCHEFVSGGPKNYGYKFINRDGKEIIELKIKGHNLNGGYADPTSAMNVLGYNQMRKLIVTNAIEHHPDVQTNQDCIQLLDGIGVNTFVNEESFGELKETIKKIPIIYKGRFRLKKGFLIDNVDAKSSYGWTYDKGMVDLINVKANYIPTVPFGYYGDMDNYVQELMPNIEEGTILACLRV